MASDTVLDEFNGPTTLIVSTLNVANLNYGTTDQATLTPASFPITAAAPGSSFEKYNRYRVNAISSINIVNNLQVFSTTALDTGITIRVNLVTTQANYSDLGKVTVYAQGVTTTSVAATFVTPTVDPATANLGIAALLTGQMTATAATSDFFTHQMQALTTANPGPITTVTWTFQRDEQ